MHLFQWAALPQLWLRSRSVTPPPPYRVWYLLSDKAVVDVRALLALLGGKTEVAGHGASYLMLLTAGSIPPLKEAVSSAFTFIFTPKLVDLPVLALPLASG